MKQEELSLEYATFEGLPPVGAVPPNSEHRVKVRLTTERLGSFRIPLQVSNRLLYPFVCVWV